MCLYLHGGAVSFAANKGARDVSVRILILQIHHICHSTWQEELITLHLTTFEQDAVDIPSLRKEKNMWLGMCNYFTKATENSERNNKQKL